MQLERAAEPVYPAAHPAYAAALAHRPGRRQPVVRHCHAPAVILEEMELDSGGIAVSHGVGDALHGLSLIHIYGDGGDDENRGVKASSPSSPIVTGAGVYRNGTAPFVRNEISYGYGVIR